MGIWVTTSTIEEKTKEELFQLRTDALDYLSENHFDAVGCAAHLGISFLEFLELKEAFREDFDCTRLKLISECEKVIADVALGITVVSPARLSSAKWMLERLTTDWQPKKTVTTATGNSLPKSTGEGLKIIERILEEEKNNGKTLN